MVRGIKEGVVLVFDYEINRYGLYLDSRLECAFRRKIDYFFTSLLTSQSFHLWCYGVEKEVVVKFDLTAETPYHEYFDWAVSEITAFMKRRWWKDVGY